MSDSAKKPETKADAQPTTESKDNTAATDTFTDTKKIAVVTGVSKGIGLAMVHELIKSGYKVIGCARNKDKIKELNTTYEGKGLFISVDVSDSDSVKSFVDKTIDKYGSPSLLILNAGASIKKCNIEDASIKDFDKVIKVNLYGVFYCLKSFIPFMKKDKCNSKIIVISSPLGRMSVAGNNIYGCTKWALEGYIIILYIHSKMHEK